MADNIVRISNRVIVSAFSLLFFLVPLILTPWNFELFEFNKMVVVYVLTAIIGCAWLVKMVVTKKIIFQRSFWDIPLLIFLVSQFLSFLVSIDRHTSFWGYYSRFNGGLLSIICYLLSYWAFVSNMDIQKTLKTILWSLSAGVIVSLYGILEHFGHSPSCLMITGKFDVLCWVQDVQNRVFATLGQPNWLAAWLAALIPFGFAFTLRVKERESGRVKNFLLFYSFTLLLYLCLLYTRSRSGLLGFAVAYLAFWPLVFWFHRHNWKAILTPFLVLSFTFLVLSFIAGRTWIPGLDRLQFPSSPPHTTPQQSTGEPSPLLISESGDIRQVVWKGAIDIWRHYPVFGTGPETFAYSYYWYRPREHNDLSEWDFLYNKAHNEYLNYAATTGTVGLVSYLILIGSFVLWSLKKLKTQNSKLKTTTKNLKLKRFEILDLDLTFDILHLSLLSGFASIVATNFFGFSVVPISLLFFLFPAMAVVLIRVKEQESERVKEKLTINHKQYAIIVLILLFTFYFLLFTLKYWYADTQFSLGEKFNKARQYDKALIVLQKAVQLHPGEPFYHDELSGTAANLALSAFQQNQVPTPRLPSEAEDSRSGEAEIGTTLSAQLLALAISESGKAIKVSPYHLNFWKNRTKIFYKLAEIDEKYNQLALSSLLRAAELAPTDPKIQYNLGLLYATIGQQQTAIESLEKAVWLKPNYIDTHYALGLFYEQKGEKQKAIEQLKYIIEKINPNHQPTVEKLKELEKKP